MSLYLLAVDLNWLAQFIFTLLILAVGFLHLVKSTASNYFLAEDSDRDSDAVSDWSAASSPPPPITDTDHREEMMTVGEDCCAVCGCRTKKMCSGCKIVLYCSEACQRSHWRSEHKKECKDFKINGKPIRGTKRGSSAGSLLTNGSSKNLHQLKKILFRYENFVELFNWDKPGFPPCGLINCGNSCFANVVLQCLAYTRPLIAFLLERGHRRECRRNDWCFLCEFQTHVERAQSLHPFSPINILSRLPHIGGNLGYGKQEDAHEFMRFAIDTMQSVCLDEFGGEKAVHPSAQETTLIQHIFGGHLQSQVICTKCNNVSNLCENMMDLTVEIQGDAASLEDCLDQFTAKECLHGDNMYKCDGCNDYVLAWKRLTVRQAPNILTIALKRFQSGRFGKLNKRVTFPEILDLSPYMSEMAEDDNIYKLYAVIVHVDMLNASFFGHYICYIKDFCGKWYRVDDCKVTRVDLDEVLSQGAYMLLYSRISARQSCLYPVETPTEERQEIMEVEKEAELSSTQHVQGLSPGEHTEMHTDSVEDPSNTSSQSEAGVSEVELSSTSNCEDGKEDVEMVDLKDNCAVPLDDELCEVPLSVAMQEAAVPLGHTQDHVMMATSTTIQQSTEADISKMTPSSSLSSTQNDFGGSNRAPQDVSLTYSSDEDPGAWPNPVLDNDSMAMQNDADVVEVLPWGTSSVVSRSSEIPEQARSADCTDTSGDIGRQFSDRIQAPDNSVDARESDRKAYDAKVKPLFRSGFLQKRSVTSQKAVDVKNEICVDVSMASSSSCKVLETNDTDSFDKTEKAASGLLCAQGVELSNGFQGAARKSDDECVAVEMHPQLNPGSLEINSLATRNHLDVSASVSGSNEVVLKETKTTYSGDMTVKDAGRISSAGGIAPSNGFQDRKSDKKKSAKPLFHRGFLEKHSQSNNIKIKSEVSAGTGELTSIGDTLSN